MDLRTLFILFSLNLVTAFISVRLPPKQPTRATCNYCHEGKYGKINVHLVPHSHDDVGWLKTVDQYYYGSGVANTQEDAGVQHIIGSAIQALRSNPDRRYIQVETAFFWKWWQNQNEKVKKDVISLVNSGQLEFINGAWSMNDEATTHYQSTIDQFTWGFRTLNETLGKCARPKIGWQIDPFGHSREHASLLSQLGFRGLVIGRIDHLDKEKRRASRDLDLLWHASANLENSKIFTTMFPDLYVSEPGFCFDIICSDSSIIDDEESPDYNLRRKVEQFSKKMDTYVGYYSTSNLLIPMGGDFHYQAAEINFSNLDKLIKGFKNHPKYNVFYSTPSCYIEAVNRELKDNSLILSEKFDDFFPYSSGNHSFWTGYFASRPTFKRFERQANNILQSAKQLAAFSKMNGKDVDRNLDALREAMGIMQHHDAITGTEKQNVANDYARILTKALKKAEASVGTVIWDLLKKNSNQSDLVFTSCPLANVSICSESQKEKFLVAVQNPLSRNVTHYVRLPVNGANFKITGSDGEEVYDVFDTIHSFDYVQENTKPSSKQLVFAARNLPPLGIKLYYVEKLKKSSHNYKPFNEVEATDNRFGTKTNGFTIDTNTGRLASVTIKGDTLNISQNFFYYVGFHGKSNASDDQSSGAYIFRPSHTKALPLATKPIKFKGAKGNLVDEFIQVFSDELTQIIRMYKGHDDAYLEFDWIVGNLEGEKGKEVITRFTVSDFNNAGVFYTDSNGREQIKREVNKRRDYQYDPEDEPTASNYYPVTSKIVIKDETKKFEVAVLNDRAQGGTSLYDGSIDLMIHRKCTNDDNFGVEEVLNEKQYGKGIYVRGQHFLTFGGTKSTANATSTAAFERQLALKKLLAPWVLFVDGTDANFDSIEKIQNLVNFEFKGLNKSLPENVHILTFEPWRGSSYILRLEHILEKDEDINLSQNVKVDLKGLFNNFDIKEITETTLGANQQLDDYNNEEKLVWNGIVPKPSDKLDPKNILQIELKPMQIRTFIVKVTKE